MQKKVCANRERVGQKTARALPKQNGRWHSYSSNRSKRRKKINISRHEPPSLASNWKRRARKFKMRSSPAQTARKRRGSPRKTSFCETSLSATERRRRAVIRQRS